MLPCETVAAESLRRKYRPRYRVDLLPYAARVIQTSGVSVYPHTGRTNGLHLLWGAVRHVTVECERLLEPNGIAVAPAGKLRALDLVEPIIGKEHRGRGEMAVRPGDAELPAIDPVDAVGDVDLQLAALRHSLDGLFDDRTLLQAGIAAIHDRHLEQAIVVASRIDTRRHHFAGNDLKHRHLFDVRIGREDDPEAFGNRVEFLPFRGRGAADDKRRQHKGDQAHLWSPLERRWSRTTLGAQAFLWNAPARFGCTGKWVTRQCTTMRPAASISNGPH